MSTTPFLPSDVGRDIISGAGAGTITAYTDPSHVVVTIYQDFLSTSVAAGAWTIMGSPQTTCTPSASTPVGAPITLTLAVAGWRLEDVGKYVSINGGLCKITSFTSSTIVNATIVIVLTSPTAAPALAWSLEGSMWGGVYGWPRCGTLFEQRLWVAGSPGFPTTMWGSTSGEYFDFLIGVLDNNAISYAIAQDYNPIRHLMDTIAIIALTYGGEYSIRGGFEKAIAPTSIQVKHQSNYGSSNVAPQRIENEILFNQRAGRKVRAMTHNFYNTDFYLAPDVSVFSEHITTSGVTDMTYCQEPDNTIMATRADGQLATMTISREQDVIAWARQMTQGRFESCASIPTPTGDVTAFIVSRSVGGVSVRFIEMMDRSLNTDAAVTGSSPTGATVWSGLTYLNGRTVNVKGDGVALQDQVVSGGSITVERPVFNIEIGLNYVTTILTLTPEIQGPTGSIQGANLACNQVSVRLRDSLGCTINGQLVSFKNFGLGVLDQAPVLFSGDKLAGNLGWGKGNYQTLIEQRKPYPLHVLAVITQMTSNDG